MRRNWVAGVGALLTLVAGIAAAELQIDITRGAAEASPIAVVPFGRERRSRYCLA